MYLPRKLTIHPSSYDNSMGRKARKTSSILKLVRQWRAAEAASMLCIESGPSLSGAPATIQAATKVNFGCSIVTNLSTSTECAETVEVEPIVSGRRLILARKKWFKALANSTGVKEGGMNQHTNAETWDLPTSSGRDRMSDREGQSISAKREIGGNARLGKSEEIIVVMNLRTLQPQGCEGSLLCRMFPNRRRVHDCR